jgi:hypothetical protein
MGAELKVRVGINHAGFATGLRTMENMVSNFASKAGAALGAAVGVHALFEAAKGGVELADRLDDLSKRFDVSASKLQMLGNVASQEGASLEDVSSALKFLGKNAQIAAAGGSADLVAAFQAIGVSTGELRSLKPDELFLRLADAFSSGQLSGQEFSTTALLLGRGFEQLLPVLRKSREEIERIGKSKGVFNSDEEIAALAKVADLMEKIANLTKVIAAQSLLGGIKGLGDSFKEFLGQMDGPFAQRELAAMRMNDPAPSPRRDPNRKIKKSLEVEDLNPAARIKAAETYAQKEQTLADMQRKRDFEAKASAEQVGQLQAEALQLQIEINNLGDDRNKQQDRQIELAKTLNQLAGVQKNEAAETARFIEDQSRAMDAARSAKENLKTVEAQISGPSAEAKLRAERVAAAVKNAQETQTVGDVLDAKRLILDQKNQRESDLRSAGFPADLASRMASSQAEQAAMGLPSAKDFNNISGGDKTVQPVKLENPPDLKGIMDKLDTLIKNAGVFS